MRARWFTGALVVGAFASGVLLGGWSWSWFWNASPQAVEPNSPEAPTTVSLPAGVTISLAEARVAPWQPTRRVPARTDYDQTRRVEVPATANAIVLKMLVQPGDAVKLGQAIAQLSSAEVATMRSELLLRDEELALAEQQLQWADLIYGNTMKLIAAMRNQPDVKQLETDFRDIPLGQSREKLMAAYARWQAARQLAEAARSLAEDRALTRPTQVERELELHTATAALWGLCEEVEFQLKQARNQALVARNEAQRRRDSARRRLATVLGYEESPADTQAAQDLSLFEVRAPTAGTVERRYKAPAERVAPGDPLFLIADTRRLWVRAELREQDWWSAQVEAGQHLKVAFPGQTQEPTSGRVVFVGREASAASRAIPIVLEIENPDGHIRPGMFAEVHIPVGAAATAHSNTRVGCGVPSRQDVRLRKNPGGRLPAP
ncbi:MAG: hypothetical protein KatS3mg110_3670 [Pirellulaceae bacterium]|nr:MAG: hypothetical protein KatS3mg110_3670 [Pirellulaceae bacterium]